MPKWTVEFLEQLLPQVCDRDTSLDDQGWTPGNPLWGHCAVVALVVQDLFGGDILRASLEHIPAFAHLRSHYWNRLPDGRVIDLTRTQFGQQYPALTGVPRARREILDIEKYPKTVQRYDRLKLRLLPRLYNRPLVDR